MKKIFGMPVLALALVSLLVFAGCSSQQTAPTEGPGDGSGVSSDGDTGGGKPGVVEEDTGSPGSGSATNGNGTTVTPPKNGGATAQEGLNTIYFDYDQSAITQEASAILKANKKYLLGSPDVRVMIEGHCDERGTNEYNLALGERRANATRRFLSDLGIDPNRMETISYGEEKPADKGGTEAAWAKNRRAEFKHAQ